MSLSTLPDQVYLFDLLGGEQLDGKSPQRLQRTCGQRPWWEVPRSTIQSLLGVRHVLHKLRPPLVQILAGRIVGRQERVARIEPHNQGGRNLR